MITDLHTNIYNLNFIYINFIYIHSFYLRQRLKTQTHSYKRKKMNTSTSNINNGDFQIFIFSNIRTKRQTFVLCIVLTNQLSLTCITWILHWHISILKRLYTPPLRLKHTVTINPNANGKMR